MGIMDNIVRGTTDINDEIIAGNMLASSKGAADVYLNATLTSSTPELRAIYSASLNQIIGGNSTLTDLAVNRGWVSPYSEPSQQLAETFNKSKTTIDNK